MEPMMNFGWVGAAIIVVVLVGAAVAATYFLRRNAAITAVLAFVGILALLAVGAMALMHWGMMGGLMRCCT
jgi:hypothetical protein